MDNPRLAIFKFALAFAFELFAFFAFFSLTAIAAPPNQSSHTSPLLRCNVTYAGSTQIIDTRPVADSYGVPSIDIGGRFRFKPVMVGRGQSIQHITLYAYLETRTQPVLIQQATYLPPFNADQKTPLNLTGEQHLYAGPVERELIYLCTLHGITP